MESGSLDHRELALFHRGDHTFFRVVVDTYSPRLMAITMAYANDRDDAGDLLQETWLRVYQKRNQFRGSGALVGWLYSVCRSVCLDACKKRQTRARLMTEASTFADGEVSETRDTDELRRSLLDALTQLPERQRDVAILRLVEGCSTKETAKRLNCAEGTVKAALHHAVKKLQTLMEVWVS